MLQEPYKINITKLKVINKLIKNNYLFISQGNDKFL